MEMRLKNYMEDMVQSKLPQVLERMDVCKCERCQLDIMAYVLNKLPPKYVVTTKGTMYAKLLLLQSQFEADVVTGITQAAAVIDAAPRHES